MLKVLVENLSTPNAEPRSQTQCLSANATTSTASDLSLPRVPSLEDQSFRNEPPQPPQEVSGQDGAKDLTETKVDSEAVPHRVNSVLLAHLASSPPPPAPPTRLVSDLTSVLSRLGISREAISPSVNVRKERRETEEDGRSGKNFKFTGSQQQSPHRIPFAKSSANLNPPSLIPSNSAPWNALFSEHGGHDKAPKGLPSPFHRRAHPRKNSLEFFQSLLRE